MSHLSIIRFALSEKLTSRSEVSFGRKYYRDGKLAKITANLRRLTGDVVAQYSRRDNSAVRAEEILQILLRHIFRQAAHVQIRAFDRLAARSRVRHLEEKSKTAFQKNILFSIPTNIRRIIKRITKNEGNVGNEDQRCRERCLTFYRTEVGKKEEKNVPTR